MNQPSIRNLNAMPSREDFIRITKAIATLDAIISPEWECRYYSFDCHWDESEQLASMRNGSGEDWQAHITDAGIIVFGLDHESTCYRADQPLPGLLDQVPPVFAESVAEPAFDTSNLSFCCWLLAGSDSWATGIVDLPEGPDPDGSERLLSILDGSPGTYAEWAESYYERPIELSAVRAIYAGSEISEELIRTLNPETSAEDLREDAGNIGFSFPAG